MRSHLVLSPLVRVGLILALMSGCSSPSEPEVNTSFFTVTFYGYSPAWASGVVTLTADTSGPLLSVTGLQTATEFGPHVFPGHYLRVGDTVTAVALLRSADGAIAARLETSFEVRANWNHAIGFQVGGRNPDLRGFCHRRPLRQALPGAPGDTLFLWDQSLEIGPVC